MKSWLRSERAAWVRSTARTTQDSTVTWHSKSCRTRSPGIADRLARFEREARTVARLNHPNIVVIYGIEEFRIEGAPGLQPRGTFVLIMELVEGQDLSRMVRPGGLPLAQVLDLAIPLADALAIAHSRGVVHRDLKPANVMVTHDGRVKVLDFGLAKASIAGSEDPGLHRGHADTAPTAPAASDQSPLSIPGQLVGTVAYMAPEQVRGRPRRHPHRPVRAWDSAVRIGHGPAAVSGQHARGPALVRSARRAAAGAERSARTRRRTSSASLSAASRKIRSSAPRRRRRCGTPSRWCAARWNPAPPRRPEPAMAPTPPRRHRTRRPLPCCPSRTSAGTKPTSTSPTASPRTSSRSSARCGRSR